MADNITNNTENEHDKLPFNVIVEGTLKDLVKDFEGDTDKKYLLHIANYFQDGHWWQDNFIEFVFNNLKYTALSEKERQALIGSEYSILQKGFSSIRALGGRDKGSEIAEIVLYGILRCHYKVLPVVPKIFYKQNCNDYAKGADSVHISIDEKEDFAYWLGEAKFYTKISFPKIIESVQEMLSTKKIKRESTLITSHSDLKKIISDEKTYNKIVNSLSDGVSMDEIRKKLHVPIFILYECNITKKHKTFSDEYKKELKHEFLIQANKYFLKQNKATADKIMFSEITFHLILFPVPDRKSIVEDFFTRGEAFK